MGRWKLKNNKKGITLIALVITIIVLLILAGITIATLTGENGILTKAMEAGTKQEYAQLKEELELEILNIQTNKISNGEDFTREDLQDLSNIGAEMENYGIPAEGEYKDHYFEIDENYRVTIIGKLQGEKPKITGEVMTTGIVDIGGTVEIKVTATIGQGSISSIEATNGAVLKQDISVTEKVYEVNANGTYYFKARADNGRSATVAVEINNIIETPKIEVKDITPSRLTIQVTNDYAEGMVTEYRYYLNGTVRNTGTTNKEYRVTGLAEEREYTDIYVEAIMDDVTLKSNVVTATTKEEVMEIVWTNDTNANRTIDGAEATYQNPIIPVGFSAVNTEDAIWNKEKGTLSQWNNGLVIKDIANGNEFVWVPVDGTNVTYERWCTVGYSYTACKEVASTSGLDLANNVTTYGGFWIARYEAGLPMTVDQTTASATIRDVLEKPLSIAGAVPWNFISYNNSKVNAENMYVNEYVQSGLINGTQWDTIMKWIQSGGQNLKSEQWGNHNNSSVILRGGNCAYVSTNNGANWINATETTKGITQMIKTGASNGTREKNIYDIAGNVWEYTCEMYSNYPIIRGSGFNDNNTTYPVEYRNYTGPTTPAFNIGFRANLYIK